MKYNKDILDRFLTENVAINVETQQEWDDFMKLLESETECKWSNHNNIPTYHNHWTKHKTYTSVAFNFDGFERLGFAISDFYQSRSCEVIKYKVLIKEKKQ